MNTETKWVHIERTIDAPIETVWKMWTDPTLFSQWYGPRGMSISVAEMDVQVGGKRKICMAMETPERPMQMWFSGEYTAVNQPNELTYTESMCDAEGNLLDPKAMGMPDDHPQVTEVIVQLKSLGDQTMLKLIHIGVPADSGGAGGWAFAIDALAQLVVAE